MNNNSQGKGSYLVSAYCINLESETARRVHCETEYKKVGINAKFWKAVDGRKEEVVVDLPMDEKDVLERERINELAMSTAFFNRSMNSAERACALSHYQVWEEIEKLGREDNEKYFLVNEDDFNVIDLEGFDAAMDNKGLLQFDMIYLGYRGGEPKLTSRERPKNYRIRKIWHWLKAHRPNASNEHKFRYKMMLYKVPKQIGSSFFMRAGLHWGGHAYLLNAKGAKALMNCNYHLRFLPDEAMRFAWLDSKLRVGISKKKYFGCDTSFGSALRSQEDHDRHHQLYPSNEI